MPSYTSRTSGAAVVAPVPPWLTCATTTSCGSSAGAYEANHDVSCLPVTCPVPVLPATASGRPANTPCAVPPGSVVTPARASRSRASVAARTGTRSAFRGVRSRTPRPSAGTTARATEGRTSRPPLAIAA